MKIGRDRTAWIMGASAIVVGSLLTIPRLVVVVPAGHVGVVDTFGVVSSETLKAGVHLTNPVSKVVKLSTRTREIKESTATPSQEGLNVTIDVSILYHLDPEKAQEIYQKIGPNYEEIVLIPQFRSIIRGVTSRYNVRDLYTAKRQEMAQQILQTLQANLAPRGIVVEETPLRKIELPANLQAAVEEKLKAEQESQRMQFVLEQERQEAERKRIAAKGTADAQRIIGQGLNSQTLQWRSIEAMEKLANSQNTKVVIMGADNKNAPILLQP